MLQAVEDLVDGYVSQVDKLLSAALDSRRLAAGVLRQSDAAMRDRLVSVIAAVQKGLRETCASA